MDKGTYKYVFSFPKFGFVIKFPIIRVKECVSAYRRGFLHLGGIKYYHTFIWYIFRGINENWNEFKFYRKHKSSWLLPTYFSLFGLINIQKYGPDCGIKTYSYFHRIIKNDILEKDRHHFENNKNFSIIGDCLYFRDYGGRKTQKIIRLLIENE
jgi:hypothetical protein